MVSTPSVTLVRIDSMGSWCGLSLPCRTAAKATAEASEFSAQRQFPVGRSVAHNIPHARCHSTGAVPRFDPMTKTHAKRNTTRNPGHAAVDPRFDWKRIAYNVLVSRALDDLEETTNRNRNSVPREHLVLYQFSARGHDVAQTILGSMLDHPHDGVGAYYRSRPLLLSLGLSIEDALASPLGRSGGFSDGRDIGVVCNMPNQNGTVVLPMSGDVGSQYTPAAGWAQAITYHRDVL